MDSLVTDTIFVVSKFTQTEEFIIKLIPTIITSIIAITAVTIAYFQWRINQLKVRHDLFEKRLKVYDATFKFIQIIIAKARPSKDDIYEFTENTRLSKFLFRKNISNYLKLLREKATALIRIDLEMNKLRRRKVEDEKEWTKVTDKDFEIFDWFISQFNIIEEKFYK